MKYSDQEYIEYNPTNVFNSKLLPPPPLQPTTPSYTIQHHILFLDHHLLIITNSQQQKFHELECVYSRSTPTLPFSVHLNRFSKFRFNRSYPQTVMTNLDPLLGAHLPKRTPLPMAPPKSSTCRGATRWVIGILVF